MSAGAVKFAETVLQLFPPFRWEADQEDRWMEIIAGEIGGFSDEILEKALSNLIRRKDHRTPTVGECINACVEAKRWLERDQKRGELPIEDSSGEWSTERQRLAYEICRSTQVGKRAAKEGWILSLWTFIRKNQRAPTAEHEIAACKKSTREFDEAFARCVRGKAGPKSEDLVKLGEAMLEKRERLRAEALGR